MFQCVNIESVFPERVDQKYDKIDARTSKAGSTKFYVSYDTLLVKSLPSFSSKMFFFPSHESKFSILLFPPLMSQKRDIYDFKLLHE